MEIKLLNWREIPMVRLCLALVIGIMAGAWQPAQGASWQIAAAIGLIGLAGMIFIGARRQTYDQRWVFGVLLYLSLSALGYVLVWMSDERNVDHHFSQYLLKENMAVAEVQQVQWRNERFRITVNVEAIGRSADKLQPVRGRLMLYLPVTAESEKIGPGSHLVFSASITGIPPPLNPKAFDYARYQHYKNIHYQAFVGEDAWRLSARPASFSLSKYTDRARSYCLAVLRKHLPTPNEFGAASPLILGYRDETPDALRDAYSATGATHVLAVSGLHVGIVQMVISFLLQFWGRKSGRHRIPKMLITILGVWAFALITGGAGSALRAATMFSFLTVGQAMRQTSNTYNTMAASLFLLLCINPLLLFDLGVQLSYLAVLGIVFFHPRIYKLWYIENKAGDYLWQLTALSLAATLTTLPLSLLYFHQFPVYFWLSGLVAVPLSGFILGGGLLLFAVQGVPLLGFVVGKALYALVWLMNASIFLIQQIPGSRISGIWISVGVALLLYGVIIAVAGGLVTKKFRWILAALAMGVLAAGINAFEIRQAHQRREIVLYHARRQTIIDCFDGTQVFSLSANPVTPEEERFALQNYRWYCRSHTAGAWLLNDAPPPAERWWYRNGLLRFGDVRLAVISQVQEPLSEKIPTDYLLLRGRPYASLKELTAAWEIRSGTILLDGSLPFRQAARLMEEGRELGYQCYDVSTQGAWMLNLRKAQ